MLVLGNREILSAPWKWRSRQAQMTVMARVATALPMVALRSYHTVRWRSAHRP